MRVLQTPTEEEFSMRRSLILFISLAVAFLGFTATPAFAKTYVAVGGGPTGGTFNYFANGISLYVSKVYDDIQVSTEGSGGSVENVRRVHNGDFDFGISYAVDLGLGAIGELPQDDRSYDSVRSLGYLYGAPAQLVVREKSDFQSAKDLKGHEVAVGNAGSGAATSAERFFRHLDVWDNFSPQFLGYSAAASAFSDGKIEAFWVLVGYPNASIIEAATRTDIRLINVGDDATESGFYDAYAYAPTTIPAKTYSGQESDCLTFQDSTFLTARDDVDADLVYRLMKAVWSKEGLQAMQQSHKAAKSMSLENNFQNAAVPLHPGAVKFWEEQGIAVPDELRP
jgi:hypothetical protein